MDAVMENRGGPNWLLRIFFGVSVLIHFFILMHAIDPLRPEVSNIIELTINEAPPPPRMIPRPPPRSQFVNAPKEVLREVARPLPVAPVEPVKAEAIQQVSTYTHMESSKLSVPKPADIPGLQVSDWAPERGGEGIEEKKPEKTAVPAVEGKTAAREQYFSTIRGLIERKKQYPKVARLRKLEGRVVIEFELFPSGEVKSIRVAEGSRFDILNRAGTRAVEAAGPYPRPPAGLFSGNILLRIPVAFELN